MSKKNNLYIGKAGQNVVMSEFLIRGYNAGIPEVDVGDDIFVVRDSDGDLQRIQVKTGKVVTKRNFFTAQFRIPLDQLRQPIEPQLIYALAFRDFANNNWQCFIIIERSRLNELNLINNIGTISNNHLQLYVRINRLNSTVICSGLDITEYLNNFSKWPQINH